MYLKRSLSLLVALAVILTVVWQVVPTVAQDGGDDAPVGPGVINHDGQDLFLSGINLAWINFARDLTHFNEVEFIKALDELAGARGNTLRWWLHTDGSNSPIYGDDGMITGITEDEIQNLRRGLDLAYERGILIMPTLWSHDMMNNRENVPAEANKLLIEDPVYTQAYIDNALVPMVTALKGHPGIIAWEIFNEPEGVTSDLGWTDLRTEMNYIQQFVNLLAGAIHRADPDVKVTNGSVTMKVLTDVGSMTNYYTDERLVEVGGDPDGTLDFYQVHYYPQHQDESVSPFHNPYSHWELDKPLIIGEFPAAGIRNLGLGYLPRKSFQNIVKVYEYVYENGYAGALGWTYTGGNEFGGMVDLAPGLHWTYRQNPEIVGVVLGDIDHLPKIVAPIANQVLSNKESSAEVANLNEVFFDEEDGTNLIYEVTGNSAPERLSVELQESGAVVVSYGPDVLGAIDVEITATDSGGNYSRVRFVVQIADPDLGNVALGKPAIASTVESNLYAPTMATDGADNSRWSSTYEDNQFLIIDLEGVFAINQIQLAWEAAFGKHYELQYWDGSAWQTVFTETNSDGGIDDAIFDTPFEARFIRFNGIERGTQWGFSLWELAVIGARSENQESPVTSVPPDYVAPEESAVEVVEISGESTLFQSFEDEAHGWALADYWAGGTGLALSSEDATDGESSLALSISTSGSEWSEGGVYLVIPEGTDWSGASSINVDVFVPAEASDFLAQIFTKTGADLSWSNTADIPLVAGEWNTLVGDLSTLGAVGEVFEVGIKVGSGSTAFTGDFLIDNVVIFSADAGESVEVVAGESALLQSFEDEAHGWALADYWAGGTGLALSSEDATDGESSLALSISTSGSEWSEGGVYLSLGEAADWSGVSSIQIDVFVPAEASDFLAQIFSKTGADWAWSNTADIPLVAGEWNTVIGDLSSLGTINEVHEIGVKIGSGSTAFTGDFLIDNIVLIGAAE